MGITVRKLEAIVRREGLWWEILIPELGQITATQHYSDIEEYAMDLAVSVLDQPHSEISIALTMAE